MSFLKGLTKELDRAGKSLSKEVDSMGRTVDNYVGGVRSTPLLDMFMNGNVVQLVSRSSGRTLQIVTAPTGQLVIDGQGPEGPQMYNANWTVLNEGSNIVKLHNNNNYLAIMNGTTQIMHFPPGTQPALQTRFRVIQIQTFAVFDSMSEPGKHIGILNTGQLKSALATGRELDAQFGVRLIYSAIAGAAAGPVAPK